MKCLTLFLVFLALAVGGAYGGLRLFSRLSGVDMFGTLPWILNNKKLPIVLMAGSFYLVAVLCFMALLEKPANLIAMNSSRAGALLGYTDRSGVKLYDPESRDYRIYEKRLAVKAAERFTDAFSVVAFYLHPRSGYYVNMDAEEQKPWMGAIFLFVICLILTVCYLLLFKFGREYKNISSAGISPMLTHGEILANFKEVAGMPLPLIAAVVLAVLLVPWLLGGYMTHRIKSGYGEQFSFVQKDLRGQLMANVAPGKVLQGRVIDRATGHTRKRITEWEAKRRLAADDQWVYVRTAVYTIEFPGLVRYTPVYLSITRRDDAGDPVVKRLDELLPPGTSAAAGLEFGGNQSSKPGTGRSGSFIVNEDYSVSLSAESKGRQ